MTARYRIECFAKLLCVHTQSFFVVQYHVVFLAANKRHAKALSTLAFAQHAVSEYGTI